ncbi:MAG: serine O-acetyltransferase [Thermoanaerobaculia bacterium]
MFDNLRHDTRRLREIKTKGAPWYVLESLLFENGYQAVVLHRIAHWFKARRIPFFGPLFHRLSLALTGVDISPGARVGPGLFIGHGTGIVVGDSAVIGARATLLHQVTIGAPATARRDEMPVLGDDVFVGAGARVIGSLSVGDGAFIGTGCLVFEDVPAGSRVVPLPNAEIRRPASETRKDAETSVGSAS